VIQQAKESVLRRALRYRNLDGISTKAMDTLTGGPVLAGLTSGRYFYQGWADLPQWFGGAMGFAVAITLIAGEFAFRRRFTRSLVAFLIGLAGGLVMANLLIALLGLVIQDEDLRNNLDIPLGLVAVYLVLVTVVQNADRFRLLLPFFEFRREGVEEGVLVADASAICDARLPMLLNSGLLDHRLLVHRRLLRHFEQLGESDERGERLRGERGLQALQELREQLGERLVIEDTETPQTRGELAEVLVTIAHLENARMLSGDPEMLRRARAERLRVVDLHTLSAGLGGELHPGSILDITVERSGQEADQGVGYLNDGSMVVIEGASERIDTRVRATVLRLHHSSNGRMIFCELAEQGGSPAETGTP